MINWNSKLPRWGGETIEPPESKKTSGYVGGDKPPAKWENWLRKNSYESIKENREKIEIADQQLNEKEEQLNGRIDNIVATPTTVSEQEIMDARQGEISLGANLKTIDERIIAPSRTSFAKMGINLFDGVYANASLRNDGSFAKSDTALTAIIPITGGESYYVLKHNKKGNRERMGFHDVKPVAGEEPVQASFPIIEFVRNGERVVAPIGAHYMLFTVTTTSENVALHITKDKHYPKFLGYDVDLTLMPGSQDSNIFKEGDAIRDLLSRNLEGIMYSGEIHLRVDTKNKTITLDNQVRVLHQGGRCIPTNLGTPLSYDFEYLASVAVCYNPSSQLVETREITQGIPTNWLVLAILNPVTKSILLVDKDMVEIDGEKYVPTYMRELISESVEGLKGKRYFILDDIEGVYNRPDTLKDVSTQGEFDLSKSKCSDIYAIYDELVSNFPEYVTKTKLVDVDDNLQIYQYNFTPLKIEDTASHEYKKLKIVVTAGIHGYEQMSSWAAANFFKDLCYNVDDKGQLDFMKWNVEFAIVPIVNPYGYENNQRENANMIDLNRDFPPIGVASELETQTIMTFLDDNSDADFIIDFHNIGGGYGMCYSASSDSTTIFTNLIRSLTRKWRKDYPQSPQNIAFGHIKGSGMSGRLATYGMSLGMTPITLESPWMMPFATRKYDKITSEVAVDMFGNLLTSICKSIT